jgi:hypothetical protein
MQINITPQIFDVSLLNVTALTDASGSLANGKKLPYYGNI